MNFLLAGILESVRSEGGAPCRARPAPGDCSFSDCALHCKRCLRHPRDLAQETDPGRSGLFQSRRGGDNRPVRNRDRPRRVAMAARRRDAKRQSSAASDLRADFLQRSLLILCWKRLRTPGEGRIAARLLFCSDGARINDDHSHRPSRWNSQRRRSAVTCQERRASIVTSNICRTIRRSVPIDRTGAWV